MAYPVNEIFYSLQGEGFHAGTPATFVRFAGCNLHCSFCDTDFARFTFMEPEAILEEVKRYPARMVILTGGEPTLQQLTPLVELLHKNGRLVCIETNGTNPVEAPVDWITCSPKQKTEDANSFSVHETLYSNANELKIVFQHPDGLEEIAKRFSTNNLFLQPCSCKNTDETVDYIKTHPHWRLSLQTHKLIDIP